MRLGDDREHVQPEELERVPARLPTAGDVRVQTTVTLQSFSGSYSGVWLAQPDLSAFVEELEGIVGYRKGTAKLVAMSPDEFCLQLSPGESPGHYEVAVRLGRHQYSGETCWQTFVSGGFQVEFNQLSPALVAFRALMGPIDAS